MKDSHSVHINGPGVMCAVKVQERLWWSGCTVDDRSCFYLAAVARHLEAGPFKIETKIAARCARQPVNVHGCIGYLSLEQ